MPEVRLTEAKGRLGPLYQAEFEFKGRIHRTNWWPQRQQAIEQAQLAYRSLEQPPEGVLLGSATRLSILPLEQLREMARTLGVRDIRGQRKWPLIKAMQKAWEEQKSGQ